MPQIYARNKLNIYNVCNFMYIIYTMYNVHVHVAIIHTCIHEICISKIIIVKPPE